MEAVMKKIGMIIIALLFVTGMALDAQAVKEHKGQDGRRCKGMDTMGTGNAMHEEMHLFHVINSLDLKDKQIEDITALHNNYAKKLVVKRAEVQVSEIELKEILGKEPVDLKAAEDKVKQTEGIKSDIRIQLLRFNEEAKALLTPEQKTALKKKLEMTPTHGAMMGDCPMMKGMDHSTPAATGMPAKNKPAAKPAPTP
jgi:Spy/CpxP family protein refolding chaperone